MLRDAPLFVSFPNADLILGCFRKGNNLLNVDENFAVEGVRLQSDTRDVQFTLIQPEDSGRDLFLEIRGDEDDPHVTSEFSLQRLLPSQKFKNGRACVSIAPHAQQVSRMSIHRLFERHRRHHRGVAECLKLDVPPILRPFQLDDDQLCITVKSQQVNTPAAVSPISELLGEKHRIWSDDLQTVA